MLSIVIHSDILDLAVVCRVDYYETNFDTIRTVTIMNLLNN